MFKYTVSFQRSGAATMRQNNLDGASSMVQEEAPTQPPRVRPPVRKTAIVSQGPDRGIAGFLYTVGTLSDSE